MAIEFRKSQRAAPKIYAENTALTVGVLYLGLNLFFIVLLFLPFGAFESLKTRNLRSITNTTRAAQALHIILCVIFGSYSLYLRPIAASHAAAAAKYELEFPYREQLKLYQDLSSAELTLEYGSNGALEISRMARNYSEEKYNLNRKVAETETDVLLWLVLSIHAFAHVLLLQFGWLWPLRNKIINNEIQYSSAQRATLNAKRTAKFTIPKGQSVADELLKWATLREKGLVTEEEYKSARTRLIA